ncbi:MAG: hypothetical protein H6Q04_2219 [Acidobacteria bacterium]|jgi:hypothetical protein|nr:hypothetical protein [Acidobacteriota bacterium]
MSYVVKVSREFPPEWDKFVETHPFGWVTHLTAWKEAVEKTFSNIEAYCITARDKMSDQIVGGIPIYLVRSWINGKRLVSIPFATLCDPLLSPEIEPQSFWNEVLLLQTQARASRLEVRSFQYRMPELPGLQYRMEDKFKYHGLPLDVSLDTIFSRFHRKAVRPPIKKAMSQGVVVERLSTMQDVDTFYGLYQSTRRKLGLPVAPVSFFRTLWDALGQTDRVLLLGGYLHGHCIAALLLFTYKDRVSAEAVGWNDQYADRNTPSLLYWEAIKFAHTHGYKVFDFGRTDASNAGLMDYKRRWGTCVSSLPIYYFGERQRARMVQATQNAGSNNQLMRSMIRCCPHWMYVSLGKLWYNHFA